ncbi:MAG: hypothetical protein HY517_03540 [Candidatus Aenigmarchaeota archaeon]|nr:hypothetical protein [Candidatus Aenigmarchaeota archaeon]
MLWIIAIILLWVFLSIDFMIDLDLITHVIFHIIIGMAGTYYIVKNKEKFNLKEKKKRK